MAVDFDFATLLSSSFLFLLSLLHRCGAAYQAGSLSAASSAEMADGEQMKKIVQFVTCETTFVCELMFGINVSNFGLGSRLILSNNQSKATQWVLDTCLMVGLRFLIIILITASLSSRTHNMALEPRNLMLREA